MRTCENSTMDLEAMEVAGLIEILAKSSSGDVCHRELFLDDNLLVATIGTCIVFSSISNVDDFFIFPLLQTCFEVYIAWANLGEIILRKSRITLDPSKLTQP